MIILDIETTGLTHDCGICEIGAINLDNSDNYFLQDCQTDKEDFVTEEALSVNGRTREQLYDFNKQPQKKMIENYLNWVEKQPEKMFYGQNVAWDISMIQARCVKYGLRDKFLEIHGQRGMDLHTIAQEKYKEINEKYLLKKNGMSAMNLSRILEFCGLPDERINVRGEEIVKQGKFHTALEDCKLEGEALYRMKFGKSFFPEYSKFKISSYLKIEKQLERAKNDNL